VVDPRSTSIPSLDRDVMTHAALGPLDARIGLAVPGDLVSWERLRPAWFAYEPSLRADLNLYTNKDAVLFPDPVAAPDGRPAYALLHRPTWDLSLVSPTAGQPLPAGVHDPRPGIWVSFAPVEEVTRDLRALARFTQHRPVALPEKPWEHLKIGAGTPPIRTPEGWLVVYHGVSGTLEPGVCHQQHVRYSAGAMLLDAEDVTMVVWRSPGPARPADAAGTRRHRAERGVPDRHRPPRRRRRRHLLRDGRLPHRCGPAPPDRLSPVTPSARRLGVALAGCGRFGDFCLSAVADLPQLLLVGVTDTDRPRALAAADRRGTTAYPDYDALLADDRVDLVIVATPPADHAPMTLAAITAGKHVFCEKPLATALPEATAVLQAASARGVRLSVDYVLRWNPLYQLLRRLQTLSTPTGAPVLGRLRHFALQPRR
jgi:Oxidoreductase family, NAD-binding Rossmann fold/beta-1,4-mannooligosaccharide phosphorylase